jgi:phosphoglycerate kinase
MKTIHDIPASAAVALVRADLNVPLVDGIITDSTRIERLIPTLRALHERGLKVRIISHFGRPEPTADKTLWPKEFSLRLVGQKLCELMGKPVAFYEDCLNQNPTEPLALLENLRFYPGEEANDIEFAQSLAKGVDVYVNDAFSCSHRAHASTVAITKVLPAYAGLSMVNEITHLQTALEAPQRPLVAIVGGSKVSTKLALLENLAKRVDTLIIGGAMANTFLMALGFKVGKSRYESALLQTAETILRSNKNKIILPADRRDGFDHTFRDIDSALGETDYVDIGPKTIKQICGVIDSAKTVVWNGPLGLFEVPPFDEGTNAVARHVAELTQSGNLVSVAGGGDTVSALANAGILGDFTFVSTAGGAFLEWLEGRELPGVAALG